METRGPGGLNTEACLSKGKGRNPKWRHHHMLELNGCIEWVPELKCLSTIHACKKVMGDKIFNDFLCPSFKRLVATNDIAGASKVCQEALSRLDHIIGCDKKLVARLKSGVLASRPRGTLISENSELSEIDQILFEYCYFDIRDLLDSPKQLATSIVLYDGPMTKDEWSHHLTGAAIAYCQGAEAYENWRVRKPSEAAIFLANMVDMALDNCDSTGYLSQEMFDNPLPHAFAFMGRHMPCVIGSEDN